MKLADLVALEQAAPWSDDGKIPWHEPAFSARMLREHLSQQHDRASRRSGTIDEHVSWIHETLLGGTPSRILDLGCGPGFYCARLAELGHTCVGIDFSPASISHARSEAARRALPCEYRQEDFRVAEPGSGFRLVLLIFGEFNTFPPDQGRNILEKARRALAPGGTLLLEVHSEDHVRSTGLQGRTWYTSPQSVFSDEPHLCLKSCVWDPRARATLEEYFVVSLGSAEASRYVSTLQAHSDAGYSSLLHEAGFDDIERHASLTGTPSGDSDGLFVLTARRK